MHICIITRAYPPRIGGTGSQIETISKELITKGFKITIITQRSQGALNFEKKDGIEIHRTLNLSDSKEFNFFNISVSIPAMVKQIIQHKECDLFHAHDISFAGFSACIAKQLLNKPFILKYGGDLVFEYLSLKDNEWEPKKGLEETIYYTQGMAGFLHKIQNWYFKNYDIIAPDSKYGEEFLIKKGVNRDKIYYLPNCIDIEKFKPLNKDLCRKKLGLNQNKKVIFSAARLVRWKGHEVAIKAVKELVKKDSNILLIIAGTGPEEKKLSDLIRSLELQRNIQLIGNVSREEMPLYYNAADIFLLASYFDTLPNSLLEAMACGKASIVSDIEGIQEIADDSCILNKVGDFKQLAQNITKITTNSTLKKRLEKHSRKKIVEEYSNKKITKEYIKLYNKIIN